jgi:ribosomal protein S1
LKALQEDPWENAAKKYKEGEIVKGTVYAYHPFGAIISLDNEIQGQIHVSEFGGVEEMKKELTVGKEYRFTIGGVKPDEKRINLKFKPVA